MKILVGLLGVFLLLSSLDSLRKLLWSKKQFDDYVEQGKESVEIVQTAINYKAPFIISMIFTSLIIIFYFITIKILAPSELIVIPILLIISAIFSFIEVIILLKKEKFEPKRRWYDIPLLIIKSAYIIVFLSIYLLR